MMKSLSIIKKTTEILNSSGRSWDGGGVPECHSHKYPYFFRQLTREEDALAVVAQDSCCVAVLYLKGHVATVI